MLKSYDNVLKTVRSKETNSIGIPQRSNLGPTLFVWYINGLQEEITQLALVANT